ncbi:MAG: hypothetical protein KAI47_14850 [Deltaproteobacteria bacterium]|nr:hypothetical protein [Deltaproteobacteria bacterium]
MPHPRRLLSISLSLAFLLSLSGCLTPFPKQNTPKSQGSTTRPSVEGADAKENANGKKKPPQTYAEAWDLICHAERRSGAALDAPLQERAVKVSEWIVAHVTNKKARYWWIAYAKIRKADREALFCSTAKAAGQDPCPLSRLLFAKPKTGASQRATDKVKSTKTPSSTPATTR